MRQENKRKRERNKLREHFAIVASILKTQMEFKPRSAEHCLLLKASTFCCGVQMSTLKRKQSPSTAAGEDL